MDGRNRKLSVGEEAESQTDSMQAPPGSGMSHQERARVANRRLLEKVVDLEASERRMASLIEVTQQLATERDPLALLQRICAAARRITGAVHASVGIVDSDGESVEALVTSGTDPDTDTVVRRTIRLDDRLRRVVEGRETVRGLNPSGRAQDLGLPPAYSPIHSYLLTPIASPTRIHGWLAVIEKPAVSGFTELDERIARTLASQAGIAYENARLIAELQAQTTQLRAQEEQTEFAMLAARCGVWQQDLQTGRVVISPALAALLGIDPRDYFGTPEQALSRLHPDDVAVVQEAVAGAVRARSEFAVEYRYRMPDESIRRHQAIGRVTCGPDGAPVALLGVTIDVTQRHSLELQLRQAQKMEAIGQLAGGVAHDFNNLLTAILGYSRFLLEKVENSDQRRDVEEVVKAAGRASALTKQLLAFSRRQGLDTVRVDLNALIEDMAIMLRRLIGEHISLTTQLAQDLAGVRADRGHLEQVVMNLVVNARDAMPQGGRIWIETRNVDLDASYQFPRATVTPGPYVMLVISDNGCGMTEEVKAHLFEPFFTTKDRSKGTGLGLATVYGIVAQSGGYVWVYSEPGRGSTFKIYLPRETAAAAPSVLHAAPGSPGGTETVLLVEDDEAVRGLTHLILERAGYSVIEASTPAEAVERFDAADRVDLLVTDVVMPGGTGPDLYRTLLSRRPDLRVLFMSGYTDTAALDLAALERDAGFLQKPFVRDGLITKVREVLDR